MDDDDPKTYFVKGETVPYKAIASGRVSLS
jgi:hypothetical protein